MWPNTRKLCTTFVASRASKKAKNGQKKSKAGRNLGALQMIILVTEIVILNASFPPPSTCSCAAILRKLRPLVHTLLDCWGKLKIFEEQMLEPPIMCERAESLSCAQQHAPSLHDGGLIATGELKGKTCLLILWKCVWLYFLFSFFFFWFQHKIPEKPRSY